MYKIVIYRNGRKFLQVFISINCKLTTIHRNLPSLKEINFDSCPIGDWTISHLIDVTPNLTSMDLADTDVTDMGKKFIKYFFNSNITAFNAIGMVHVSKFIHLTKLSLFYCNISNVGLRHLSDMENLEVLNLDSREIGKKFSLKYLEF